MSATYAWFITEDHIETEAEGTQGPHDAPDTFGGDWKFRKFRMFDDDGILYYEGITASAEPDSEEACFGPLDDFGRPNAGATRIDLLNPESKKWETV